MTSSGVSFPRDCACTQAGELRPCCKPGILGIRGTDGERVYLPLLCKLDITYLMKRHMPAHIRAKLKPADRRKRQRKQYYDHYNRTKRGRGG